MHKGHGRRDTGLVRVVTSRGLAASLINCIIGAGIFAVPAELANSAGVYAPVAFVVCAIAIGSVAICWAEGGSRIPTSGGAYGYIETAFGPCIGYIAGTILWFSNALSSGGIAAALADVIASLVPRPWMNPVHAVTIAGVIGSIAFLNLGGASRGTRLVEGATLAKLIPLAVFLVAGAGAMHRANFVQPEHFSSSGGSFLWGRAIILAVFSLTGMETALSISGEISHPARAIPRALAMSLIPVTFLYLAIQLVAQGVLGPALAHSHTPLADAMAAIHPALRWLILAGSAVAMFGFIGSDMLSTPRILFALAREGLMPGPLGKVNPQSHAPHIAILCYAALVMLLGLTGTFAELVVLATLATAVLYILGSAAAWRLARRGVEQAGPPLRFRYLTTAMVVAIVSMLGMIALGSRAEILGVAGLIAVSALLYLLLTRLR
jgi:amino acid transporter